MIEKHKNDSINEGKITFGQKTINFSVVYSIRRKKTIALSVKANGTVLVRAPMRTSCSKITHLVKSKGEWIIKKLKFLEGTSCLTKKEFVSGESFSYLGRHLRLKVLNNPDTKKPVVKMLKGHLKIGINKKEKQNGQYTEEIKNAITEWYKKKAAKRIPGRVRIYAERMGLTEPKVLIRNQVRRWGSCNSKGELRLNWRIIMAPMSIVDYVVVHELCHLKYNNHSKAFWKYVGMIITDYESKRERLQMEGARYSLD